MINEQKRIPAKYTPKAIDEVADVKYFIGDSIESHKICAKSHLYRRIRERLQRTPNKSEIIRMRNALIDGNDDCFMKFETPFAIIGICKYENRYTRAVYDKYLDIVVTVGGGIIRSES